MTFTGVYQLENGFWAYRYTITVNGKKKDVKKVKDVNGKPFRTQAHAAKARDAALKAAQKARETGAPTEKKTLQQVYDEYCEHGMRGKAYSTIRKQNSLWKNHLQPRFGRRYVNTISVGEINDYLTELYCVEGRAYRYVEGFLRFFYLLFGQAYSHNYIDTEKINWSHRGNVHFVSLTICLLYFAYKTVQVLQSTSLEVFFPFSAAVERGKYKKSTRCEKEKEGARSPSLPQNVEITRFLPYLKYLSNNPLKALPCRHRRKTSIRLLVAAIIAVIADLLALSAHGARQVLPKGIADRCGRKRVHR